MCCKRPELRHHERAAPLVCASGGSFVPFGRGRDRGGAGQAARRPFSVSQTSTLGG
jgi:hypothetical protein